MLPVIIQNQTFIGSPKVAGADNHAHVVLEDNTRYENCTFDANGASEALKASRKTNLSFINCTFVRGVEDGADFVDCHHVYFSGCLFKGAAGPQDVTAKGACSDFVFNACAGLRRVELGNYTIYDGRGYRQLFQLWPRTPKTLDTGFYDCVPTPRVVCFWADFVHGTCDRFQYWPWIVALFFSVRRLLPETGANKGKV